MVAEVLSDIEKNALELFVTSADDQIYAIRAEAPPEVFGAFGSYFSRNPKDFRLHLLDAISGKVRGQETDIGNNNLQRLASGEFKSPAEAIRAGLLSSQKFFKEWYGKYSHKSIANMVWIPMVATNVSQLVAKELAYDQLAFFIEQSTRFVKFDPANFFVDKDLQASSLSSVYKDGMESLARAYEEFTNVAISHYQEKFPLDSWLSRQDDKFREQEPRLQRIVYNREIRGKAFDVARFLLPQGTKTNLAWIMDARSTEFDISAWKGHPLREVRDAAELIEKHAGQIAPSLLKYIEPNPYYGDKMKNHPEIEWLPRTGPFRKGVSVVSYDPDSLNKAVAFMLFRNNVGGTFAQRLKQATCMQFREKIGFLDKVTQGRCKYDEWVGIEDFDSVKVSFEIRSDIGAIRDWRRHQKWDRVEPLYTTDNGFHRPFMIDEMPPRAGEIFDQAMKVAAKTEIALRGEFPHQAQYVIPMATMHSITMSGGLDQAQYMPWTRSTPQANFSYREDAFALAEAHVKKHPWILGYETYPEEENFMEVYRDAPLKGILRLQTEETDFHH